MKMYRASANNMRWEVSLFLDLSLLRESDHFIRGLAVSPLHSHESPVLVEADNSTGSRLATSKSGHRVTHFEGVGGRDRSGEAGEEVVEEFSILHNQRGDGRRNNII